VLDPRGQLGALLPGNGGGERRPEGGDAAGGSPTSSAFGRPANWDRTEVLHCRVQVDEVNSSVRTLEFDQFDISELA
jgi:hypothetical protein